MKKGPNFDFGVAAGSVVPDFLSTQPEHIRHRLSSKEGWWQFVQSVPKRPNAPANLADLDDAALSVFNRQRMEFHAETVLVKHTQLVNAWDSMATVVMGSWKMAGPSAGITISGKPNHGKTALTAGFCREFELALRKEVPQAFTQENELVPVVYSSLLFDMGLKAQLGHVLDFFGAPASRYDREADLLERLCTTINKCKTRILVLDQAQNLRAGKRTDEKVAAAIKEVMDNTAITLIACGIDIHASGPFASSNAHRYDQDQLAERFSSIKIDSVARQSREWRRLLAGIEKTLVLTQAKPGDLQTTLADELWLMTEGAIGSLFSAVRIAANSAIKHGDERITASVLERCAPTIADRHRRRGNT